MVCAQFIGMRDNRRANHAAAQLMVLTVAGTLVLAGIFLPAGSWLLRLIFGQVEPAVMDNASIYFAITVCSFPFLALYNAGAACFRAVGNSRITMNTSLLMNLMNVIGNAICIFGLGMGVEGVAVPTLISRAAASLLLLGLLQRKSSPVRVCALSDLHPDLQLMRRILSIGIPGGVENSIFQLGKLMLQSVVSTLGTAAIAAYAVAGNLVNFLYLPGNALGIALTTVVGQCVGAGEYVQAKRYTRLLVAANYCLLAVLATTMLVGRYYWVGLYRLSGESAQMAAGLILSHSIAMVIWPPAFLMPNAFRAANDARFSMLVSVGCMWVFRVALAYLFIIRLGLSIQFVWYAMYIDWVFRIIIFCWRMHGFVERTSRRAP